MEVNQDGIKGDTSNVVKLDQWRQIKEAVERNKISDAAIRKILKNIAIIDAIMADEQP